MLILLTLLHSACAGQSTAITQEQDLPPKGSCALPPPHADSDESAIQAVLTAEGELVVKQDIDLLMRLWNDGAYIADAKNTANDLNDDQHWLDKDAIRHRYVRTVFPGAPTVVTPKDLAITIKERHATVIATTQIGTELSPAGDRWELSKDGECWVIDSLTYNLESRDN
ncbi:MAG: hypothetical protein R2932_08755 [Caldilineaceae bacterium]